MSSMHRALRGDVLVYRHGVTERMIDASLLAQHGRSGRTLLKAGAMRVVITALGPGGELPLHGTRGPRTIQVLEGDMTCRVRGEEYRLVAGDFMALGPGIRHSARSNEGAVLLLTLVHRRRAERRRAQADRRRGARQGTADAPTGQADDGAND